MNIVTLILILFFTINSFASSMLDSNYNSVDLALSSSSGEFNSSQTEATITLNPKNHNFVFSYTIANTDFDEVEFGLEGNDISRENNNFRFGYVFDYGDSHLMPFISVGTFEGNGIAINLNNMNGVKGNLFDADTVSFGFLAKILIGENSVLSFNYEHIEIDYLMLSSGGIEGVKEIFDNVLNPDSLTLREALDTIANNPLNDSQFDSVKAATKDKASILGVSYEYYFNDNLSYTLGLSMDFVADISTIKLSGKYKF